MAEDQAAQEAETPHETSPGTHCTEEKQDPTCSPAPPGDTWDQNPTTSRSVSDPIHGRSERLQHGAKLGTQCYNNAKNTKDTCLIAVHVISARSTTSNIEATSSKQITQDDFATEGDGVFTVNITNKLLNETESVFYNHVNPSDILSQGNGIIFIETGNRTSSSLALCAIESAARVYHDRPIAFFKNRFSEINSVNDKDSAERRILSSFPNVYIFHLNLEEAFKDTPLLPWYQRINHARESYWPYISSDGCRLALMWKHGGIYMDSDIISMRPIPEKNFLAAQSSQFSGNCIYGLTPQHNFTWSAMENFVKNYNGAIWGHQGPQLFTRVLKKFCDIPKFTTIEDVNCGNISFLHPQRFSPISYPNWRRYFETWDKFPTFNDSYALHLWNKMNAKHMTMVPGSNTLVEHIYTQHCPTMYGVLKRNETNPF
ncbi:alpha-1,4-N-acetylglucosaminyltransferase-like [Pelobates fuscus]|uniref:alpha-1,4-N-acetylglucosaminyltransferase-like n=1 Tax=Pelobates fuscus TaxID=191477 RepID=UPI002FE43462